MKYLFLLLHLAVAITVKSQHNTIKKIDSLLDKTWEYHTTAKLLPSIETGMQALNLAIENKYDKGMAEGYFMVADALINIGLYKEALKKLRVLEELKYYKDRVIFQSEVHRIKGRAYIKMKWYDMALNEFDKQERMLSALDEGNRKMSQLYIYENYASVFKLMRKMDAMEKYIFLGWDLLNTMLEKESYFYRSQSLVDLADLSIEKGELEKAQEFLDQSMDLVKKYKVSIYFNTLIYAAKLEIKRRNFTKAIDYYNLALVNMVEVGDKDALRDLYKTLSEFYREHQLGLEKANDYLLKYNHLHDTLAEQNQQVIDVALSQILKSKDKESAGKISQYAVAILCFGLVLLGVVVYFLWRIRRKRNLFGKQENVINIQEYRNKLLSESNRELSEQIEENKFGHLIALAKNNNPEFLVLFNELYPDVIESLRMMDPKIRSTELEFCAMAFLNFSTKNIAEYTFVTIRAVQVRKNRLRKKFNIPSEEDFNNWMREIVEMKLS